MGGIEIRVRGNTKTTAWNAHSSDIADFMTLGNEYSNTALKMVSEGGGDSYDGIIIFDPVNKQIILDTEYFKMPYRALEFWRTIGFDIVFKKHKLEVE
jgi:hypothetical protein